MVANFLAGGAAVNAFAATVGRRGPGGRRRRRRRPRPRRPACCRARSATAPRDMTAGPAMTRDEARAAMRAGIETARDLVAAGNRLLVTGDMGIANTTASAALVAAFTGASAEQVTGRGTGIDDATHARKTAVVAEALALHRPDPADPLGVLAAVGGLEHAGIAGFLLGAAALRTPVVLDGVVSGAAALVAAALAPTASHAWIAGHRSVEPAHTLALDHLGLAPALDLGLRVGEGTGALLAVPVVTAAARALADVATFDAAGVTEKDRRGRRRTVSPTEHARPRLPGRPAPAGPAGRRGRRRLGGPAPGGRAARGRRGHARREPDAHHGPGGARRLRRDHAGHARPYAHGRPRRRLVRGRGHRRRRGQRRGRRRGRARARVLRARRRSPTPAPRSRPAVGPLRRHHRGRARRRRPAARDRACATAPSRPCAAAPSPTAATAPCDPA